MGVASVPGRRPVRSVSAVPYALYAASVRSARRYLCGVVEGDAVEGVRYPSPEHMSGWWITTDRYDGDSKSLTLHHLHHLVEWRPDIAPYLALPFGFRFILGEAEHVWFDEVIASEDTA